MRHHLEHVSSDSMNWEKLAPGVYQKMLNLNEATRERTALFRFVPDEGAKAPNSSHYHSFYEELLVLDGRMTFDGELWLGERSYVYHPPFLVHGFNSDVPTTTTFLGRSPGDLDFNHPESDSETRPYYIQGDAPNRGFAYRTAEAEDSWSPLLDERGNEIGRQRILSEDTATGEGSSLLRLHEGATIPARPNGEATIDEGFIVEGTVIAETGMTWSIGDYWHRVPGYPIPELRVGKSTLIFSTNC